jgi:acid stress-induced BolA-like protein IbaG/YrbA
MDLLKLEKLITSLLPDAQLCFLGEPNCQFQLRVISQAFAGLSLVKRQQKVYEAISHLLISGELHAISMQVFTPEEWAKQAHQ